MRRQMRSLTDMCTVPVDIINSDHLLVFIFVRRENLNDHKGHANYSFVIIMVLCDLRDGSRSNP